MNEQKNYGFKVPIIDETHYKFGASNVPKVVLQQDGQWDNYLPIDEFQNINNYEVWACVSYGTLNCIEVLLKRLYNI